MMTCIRCQSDQVISLELGPHRVVVCFACRETAPTAGYHAKLVGERNEAMRLASAAQDEIDAERSDRAAAHALYLRTCGHETTEHYCLVTCDRFRDTAEPCDCVAAAIERGSWYDTVGHLGQVETRLLAEHTALAKTRLRANRVARNRDRMAATLRRYADQAKRHADEQHGYSATLGGCENCHFRGAEEFIAMALRHGDGRTWYRSRKFGWKCWLPFTQAGWDWWNKIGYTWTCSEESGAL